MPLFESFIKFVKKNCEKYGKKTNISLFSEHGVVVVVVVIWWSGLWRSGSALVSINEFNLRRARLVLG